MITELERTKVMRKYLPQHFVGLYFYILTEDPMYLSNEHLRKEKNKKDLVPDKVKINQDTKSLVILLGRCLLEQSI